MRALFDRVILLIQVNHLSLGEIGQRRLLLSLLALLQLVHEVMEDRVDAPGPCLSCALYLVLKVSTRLLVSLRQFQPVNQESNACIVQLYNVPRYHQCQEIDQCMSILPQYIIGLTALLLEVFESTFLPLLFNYV